MEKLNVLVVSSRFYPEGGGAESYAYNIAKGLINKGHNVTVICSSRKTEKQVIEGIEILRFKHHFLISSTPIKIDLPCLIERLLRKQSFNLLSINLHLPYYPDVAAIISRFIRIPYVLIYHNDFANEHFPMSWLATSYSQSFIRLTLGLAKTIITPSPFCYRESKILKPFKDKVVYIPPGVYLERYNPINSFFVHDLCGLFHETKIVLFVGQLNRAHRHKGVNFLIQAFNKVSEQMPNAHLVLVGTGDMTEEYKAQCLSLGISNHVHFTDFLAEDKLINCYQSSDVVVLPSTTNQEGFGMVLIEANACGKPVIGSKIGGIQYVIRDRHNGLLVPPKDTEALAIAIMKILQDNDLAQKMGQNGRKMSEEYGWKKLVEQTEQVYRLVAKQ